MLFRSRITHTAKYPKYANDATPQATHAVIIHLSRRLILDFLRQKKSGAPSLISPFG
jgi:hypothetical protein